jgi:glycosyltransferase involved in cell wall biosynthesis
MSGRWAGDGGLIEERMDALRIGIDGYNLALRRGTGVATYGRTLAGAVNGFGWPIDLIYGLPVSPKSALDVRESLFFARLGEGEDLGGTSRLTLKRVVLRALMSPGDRHLIPVPVTGRVQTADFVHRLPRFDRLFTLGGLFDISVRYFRRFHRFMTVRVADPPAVMHWTYPVPVRMAGTANVYTIHDLVPLRLPHTSLEDKSFYDGLVRHCLRSADHIVTVSEASRKDILDLFQVDAGSVTNTYQSIDVPVDHIDYNNLKDRLNRLFDLDFENYFLFFGAVEPKKNVGRLIEAYLSSGVNAPLVVVGAGGWRSDQELRLLNGAHGKRLAGADRIRVIDYLPRSLLLELVKGARAVVFPSLYEGFGLPAAEAMALGTPLVTSNTSSLPEIVGEAAIMVDPYDVAALAEALSRIDADADLRARLSAAGPPRAARFSARYPEDMARLYSQINDHRRLGHPSVGRSAR